MLLLRCSRHRLHKLLCPISGVNQLANHLLAINRGRGWLSHRLMVVVMLLLLRLDYRSLVVVLCGLSTVRLDHKSTWQRVQHGHRSIVRRQDLIVSRGTDNLGSLPRSGINYHRIPCRTVGNLNRGASRHQSIARLMSLVRKDVPVDRIDYLLVAMSVLNQHIATSLRGMVMMMAPISNYNILMKSSVVRRGRRRGELLLLLVMIRHDYQLPVCIDHYLAAGVRAGRRTHWDAVLDNPLLAICIRY